MSRPLYFPCYGITIFYRASRRNMTKLCSSSYNAATEAEITTLLEQAKAQAASGKTAYNGRGIAVGYLETSDAYQYQVLRFYKG